MVDSFGVQLQGIVDKQSAGVPLTVQEERKLNAAKAHQAKTGFQYIPEASPSIDRNRLLTGSPSGDVPTSPFTRQAQDPNSILNKFLALRAADVEPPGGLVRGVVEAGAEFGAEALTKRLPPGMQVPARLGAVPLAGTSANILTNLGQKMGIVPGQPADDIIDDATMTFMTSLGAQGVGEVLTKSGRFAPIRNKKQHIGAKEAVDILKGPESAAARKAVSDGTNMDFSLSLAQTVDNAGTNFLWNMARGGALTSNKILKRAENNNKVFKILLEDMASESLQKMAPEDAGILFKQMLDKEISLVDGIAIGKGRNVDTILKQIREAIGKPQGLKISVPGKDVSFVSSSPLLRHKSGKQIIKDASNMSMADIGAAMVKLDGMGEIARKANKGEITRLRNLLTRVRTKLAKGDISEEVTKALIKDPELAKNFAALGRSWPEMMEDMAGSLKAMKKLSEKEAKLLGNDTFIRELAGQKPEVIMDTLLTKYANKPKTLDAARKLIRNGPDGDLLWRRIEGIFHHRLANMTIKGTNGRMDAGAMINFIEHLEDTKALSSIFHGPAANDRLHSTKRILKAIVANNRKPSSDTGKFVVELRQGAVLMGLAGAAIGGGLGGIEGAAAGTGLGLTGSGIIILGGPVAIEKLFTNKAFVNYLVNGLEEGILTKTRFWLRAASILGKEGLRVQPMSQQQDQQSSLSQMGQSGAF